MGYRVYRKGTYTTYDTITYARVVITTGVTRSNTFPGEYFNPAIITTKTIKKTGIYRTCNVLMSTYSIYVMFDLYYVLHHITYSNRYLLLCA